MTFFPEYENYDGLGLSELVKSGEITPTELLDAATERLSVRNPAINAFAHLFVEEARGLISSRPTDGPFTGVPFALKDLFMFYEGQPTGNGSRFWGGFMPAFSSELFVRYKAAGFSIFGKTTTAEVGLSAVTETSAYGVTRNPWNLNLTPGGSSGGAAAAVAAGILPLAHASDSGGSLRIPASCCGLFGFKPSRGRIPMGPERGESSSGLGTAHAVTRSVRDSAVLLDITAGPDLGAPYEIRPQKFPYAHVNFQPFTPLRIALLRSPMGGGKIDPKCIEAVDSAAKLCVDLGHVVEEAEPDLDHAAIAEALPVMMAMMAGNIVHERAKALQRLPERHELQNVIHALVDLSNSVPMSRFPSIMSVFHKAGRDLARFQKKFDVILSPTLALPPVPVGYLDSQEENVQQFAEKFRTFTPFTIYANLTGVPAMSVPLHWTNDNIPIGVQFMGRFGEEELLFQLAFALEEARPWFNKRPCLNWRASDQSGSTETVRG